MKEKMNVEVTKEKKLKKSKVTLIIPMGDNKTTTTIFESNLNKVLLNTTQADGH